MKDNRFNELIFNNKHFYYVFVLLNDFKYSSEIRRETNLSYAWIIKYINAYEKLKLITRNKFKRNVLIEYTDKGVILYNALIDLHKVLNDIHQNKKCEV